MKILIAIPARLESERLPRKLLLADTGTPLILHTYGAAINALRRGGFCAEDMVLVFADDPSIVSVIEGGDKWDGINDGAIMTGYAENGTQRIADNLPKLDFDLIVNLQADEPEIKPEHISELINTATRIPGCDMATLATFATLEDHQNPDVVKVRRGDGGYATQFSRKPLACGMRHIGIYAYTPKFLKWFAGQKPTGEEKRHSLEQLRALDNGCRIAVGVVDHPQRGIDTREDYAAFVERSEK